MNIKRIYKVRNSKVQEQVLVEGYGKLQWKERVRLIRNNLRYSGMVSLMLEEMIEERIW